MAKESHLLFWCHVKLSRTAPVHSRPININWFLSPWAVVFVLVTHWAVQVAKIRLGWKVGRRFLKRTPVFPWTPPRVKLKITLKGEGLEIRLRSPLNYPVRAVTREDQCMLLLLWFTISLLLKYHKVVKGIDSSYVEVYFYRINIIYSSKMFSSLIHRGLQTWYLQQ